MKSFKSPQLSLILVVGTAATLVIAALLYFVDPNKSTSLICSLVAFAITLLLELISRLSELSRTVSRSLELLRIFASRPPWLFHLTEECVQAADKTLDTFDHEILHEAARRYLQSCRDNLDELSRGYMRVSADDKRLSLLAIRGTTKRIRAVSIVRTDLPTWFTPSGERYLAANEAAVGRGVRVERIFIHDQMSDDLLRLIRRLQAMNSHVYLLKTERVPVEKRIDMVLFDDAFAVETRTNAEGVFVENQFSANISDIQKRSADFEFLLGIAEEQIPTGNMQMVPRSNEGRKTSR